MSLDKPIHRIAIVGTGVIGRELVRPQYLARGFDVVARPTPPRTRKPTCAGSTWTTAGATRSHRHFRRPSIA